MRLAREPAWRRKALDQVDEQADGRDRQHRDAGDRMRRTEPLPGLGEDVAGHRRQHQGVGECGEDLDPVVPVGPAGRWPTLRELHGGQGQDQAGDVRQHVAGVGEEREAAGEEAGRDLDGQESAGQPEDDREPAPAGVMGVGVLVGHPSRG